MDEETYQRKRRELSSKYPVYLSSKWLRNTRIIFTVCLLILVKVTQSTLPIYDIKCLHDNVLESMEGLQNYFSNPNLVLSCEIILFVLLFGCVAAMAVHWIVFSDSLKLPVVILIFYVVKLLSDCSLIVDKPPKVLWENIAIFGTSVGSDRFFFSNVDPISGLLLISFLYSLSIEGKAGRISCASISFFAFVYGIVIQLIFQLVHSYAVFSAIIVVGFGFIIGDDIIEYIQRKKEAQIVNQSESESEPEVPKPEAVQPENQAPPKV